MSRLLRICVGLLLAGPLLALAPALRRFAFEGRVTDGREGIAGCRVYPDRPHRPPGAAVATPVALTDAHGRFRLELEAGDAVLAVEKDGWCRDLAPLVAFRQGLALRPAPFVRVEKVAVVRLGDPKARLAPDDALLRRRLFSREPNVSSVANYVYEVSKGALSLEEGRWTWVRGGGGGRGSSPDATRGALARLAIETLEDPCPRDLDAVDNATGEARPDGKPDHLWVFARGPARAVTTDPRHLTPLCYMMKPPRRGGGPWPVVVATDQSPIGLLAHEAFHAMGEHRADDLYLDCEHPMTAGVWDLMDAGQYRGWEAPDPAAEGWMDGVGASPSHPGPWVRGELWYRGRLRETVPLAEAGGAWEGWMDPLVRAPGEHPQALRIPDPGKAGAFWELSVRRPWGFDAGRIGGRWGPGHEGLVVAHVDPSLLSDGEPLGPVRVVDAHPGTPAPPRPRLPCGRHELDDAAFNRGPGERSRGSDGPLAWEVLATDGLGRMKVRTRLASPSPREAP